MASLKCNRISSIYGGSPCGFHVQKESKCLHISTVPASKSQRVGILSNPSHSKSAGTWPFKMQLPSVSCFVFAISVLAQTPPKQYPNHPKPPTVKLLFSANLTLSAPTIIGTTPFGQKAIVPIIAGTVAGPNIHGPCPSSFKALPKSLQEILLIMCYNYTEITPI